MLRGSEFKYTLDCESKLCRSSSKKNFEFKHSCVLEKIEDSKERVDNYLLFPRNPSSIDHFLVHGSQLELELGSIQKQLENVPMSGFSFVCDKISI